jgi:voltage-gated potassium channel
MTLASTLPPPVAALPIRRRVFEILDAAVIDKASKTCETFLAVMVVTNVLFIILESEPVLHQTYGVYFHWFDIASVAVFTVEYLLRVWSFGAKYLNEDGGSWRGRKEYLFGTYGAIDFISTAPFFLQLLMPGADLRALRLCRLLRIFKLSRYNSALNDMFEAIKEERDSFISAMFLLFISCLLFSSLIYILEGHAQPEIFPSIPAAMHWFILTLISGWGNVNPVTYLGTALVIFTQVLAIALAAVLTGVVSTSYTAQVLRREAMYEREIREVLADGVVTDEERIRLRQMQAKFGISDEQVAAIAAQVDISGLLAP